MNIIRDIGSELKNISNLMLDDVESILHSMGVCCCIHDRDNGVIIVKLPGTGNPAFHIFALPRSRSVAIRYITGIRRQSSSSSVCRLRYRKNCRDDLARAMLSLMSRKPPGY